MKFILSILSGIILFSACENDMNDVNRLFSKEETKMEKAKEVEMLYSDSAILRLRIISPLLIRHTDSREPWQEFPEGLEIQFYNEAGKVTSRLTANYATRSETDNKFIVRDSVVWHSEYGEKLESEELIWEEATDKVHTNKSVIVRRSDEIIFGHGFESNQQFTQWKVRAIKGRIKAKDLTEDFKN